MRGEMRDTQRAPDPPGHLGDLQLEPAQGMVYVWCPRSDRILDGDGMQRRQQLHDDPAHRALPHTMPPQLGPIFVVMCDGTERVTASRII